MVNLPAGEALTDHEVRERAYVVVVAGEVTFTAGDDSATVGAGGLAAFDAGERHEVRAGQDARLLLLLAPWPADGHDGVRSDTSAEAGTL